MVVSVLLYMVNSLVSDYRTIDPLVSVPYYSVFISIKEGQNHTCTYLLPITEDI